jgi:hypothetical protein
MNKDAKTDLEECAPLSVRKAREARRMRDEAWPYIWINFASMIILVATLAIVCYRIGAHR